MLSHVSWTLGRNRRFTYISNVMFKRTSTLCVDVAFALTVTVICRYANVHAWLNDCRYTHVHNNVTSVVRC